MKTTQHIISAGLVKNQTSSKHCIIFVAPHHSSHHWFLHCHFLNHCYLAAWIVFLIPLCRNLHDIPLCGDVEVPEKVNNWKSGEKSKDNAI